MSGQSKAGGGCKTHERREDELRNTPFILGGVVEMKARSPGRKL
jgi:hypothetical protein